MVFYFYACCFSKGVMRGQRPLIVLFCHSRNLLSGIQVFKYHGPRLKDCRGDRQGVIETFRNDPLFCHSRNLLSGIQAFASSLVFKYYGPLIEPFRGDE